MPYNTRRKSLSLSELGIIVPKRSRAASHPSPPSTIAEEEPPVKKSKRSHASNSPSPGLMSPPRTTTIRIKTEEPKNAGRATELSPPASPVREGASKIDTEGINDDIVVGAIQQLEKTGNRPHLVKELAAILAHSNHAIEKYGPSFLLDAAQLTDRPPRSANPSALISSRLTAYLNRSWPTISPCPLAKDLSPVHPRRLYFYLTTSPHQPIPEVAELLPKPKRVISPSLSSASAADEDDRYTRGRTALSPSPEVDLSSPELEDQNNKQNPPTPGGSFSARNSLPREHPPTATNLAHNRRAASPPLEREERDFKQTANALQIQLQQRRNSQDVPMSTDDAPAGVDADAMSVAMSVEAEESEESAALKNMEAAKSLFEGHAEHLGLPAQSFEFSSPMLKPEAGLHIDTSMSKLSRVDEAMDSMMLDLGSAKQDPMLPDAFAGWDGLQSPENVELDELEDLFDAY